MRVCAGLMLFLVLLVSNSSAETGTDDRFRSYIKQISCADILKNIENPDFRQGLVLTVSAFVSGSNLAKKRVSRLDIKGMMLLTEQYCRQNPQAPLLHALVSLDRRIDRTLAFTPEPQDN